MVALLLTACGETKTRKEINRRKAALVEHQQTELKKAQDELWLTDSLLQQTNDLQLNILSVKTGIPIHSMTALLFQLEMKGVVKAMAGGTYHLIL